MALEWFIWSGSNKNLRDLPISLSIISGYFMCGTMKCIQSLMTDPDGTKFVAHRWLLQILNWFDDKDITNCLVNYTDPDSRASKLFRFLLLI